MKANKVILFVSIERTQHESLRYLAYKENRSMADITREALNKYLRDKLGECKEVKDESSG